LIAQSILGSYRGNADQNVLRRLDESEILGNICILLIAGHETSASLLETALILLATEPDFQQSIQDEIDSIWAGKKPGEDLTYAEYPKMATIMALMVCPCSSFNVHLLQNMERTR
jgi:cytochrome P450